MTLAKKTRIKEISKSTTITLSLGLIATLFGSGILGVWKVRDVLQLAVDQFAVIDTRLSRIEQQLARGWTYPMQREYSADLQHLNPGLKAPNAADIHKEHRTAAIVPDPAPPTAGSVTPDIFVDKTVIIDDCSNQVQ
jgi:hypothetical protein